MGVSQTRAGTAEGAGDDLDFPMRWRPALVLALFLYARKQFALFNFEEALHNARVEDAEVNK